jgi:leucyl aminopeptidase
MGNDETTIHTLLDPQPSFALERYWRLPYEDYYREKTKAIIADIKNITSGVKA